MPENAAAGTVGDVRTMYEAYPYPSPTVGDTLIADVANSLYTIFGDDELSGKRILDAGCGTGALAVEAAQRGAEVVAIDVAGSLVEIARKRAPQGLTIDWRVGDMLDPALGSFDHVVEMDSLIHYKAFDIVDVIRGLSDRTRKSMVFTFAPQTPLLMVALGMGRLFPRNDRSPAIIPVRERLLRTLITNAVPKAALGRDRKVSGGFYTSHALEVLLG